MKTIVTAAAIAALVALAGSAPALAQGAKPAAADPEAQRTKELEALRKRLDFDTKAQREEADQKKADAKAAEAAERQKAADAEAAEQAKLLERKKAEEARRAREARCVFKPVMTDAEMQICREAFR